MRYKYKTNRTCARQIIIDIENDIIRKVEFIGGCSGNAQGISSLVKGMKSNEVIDKLKNIDCAGRGTSCPDQLARALEDITNGVLKEDTQEAFV